MRFQKKIDEAMGQDKIDKILLKSESNQVFRAIQRGIDNYIGNIETSLKGKDVLAKKKFAFKEIMKYLAKREKDIR